MIDSLSMNKLRIHDCLLLSQACCLEVQVMIHFRLSNTGQPVCFCCSRLANSLTSLSVIVCLFSFNITFLTLNAKKYEWWLKVEFYGAVMFRNLLLKILLRVKSFARRHLLYFGGGESGGRGGWGDVEAASIAGLFSLQTAEYATSFSLSDRLYSLWHGIKGV